MTNILKTIISFFLFFLVSIQAFADGSVWINNNPFGASLSAYFTNSNAADITDTSAAQIKGVAATGSRYYVTNWVVSNMSAVPTRVDLIDSSTLVMAQCPAAASGGGCSVNFEIPLRFAAASSIFCRNATTGAAVRCTVVGFVGTK